MKSLLAALILSFLSLAIVGLAEAGVIQYADRPTFNSQGTVAYNYDFEDVGTPNVAGFHYPGTPWTTHGVTYGESENLVLLPTCYYAPLTNVLADTYGTISATLDTGYDMLGMDLAALASTGDSSILLKTNLEPGGYSVDLLSLPVVSASQQFYGFVTDTPGEYFTGFTVDYPVQTTIDNVTLGVVPEPGVLALLGTALLGLGGFLVVRRKCPGKAR